MLGTPPRDSLARAVGATGITRRDLLRAGAAAGLHLLAWLPEDADELAIAGAARRRGVAVQTLHRHCTAVAPVPPALLLGYAQLGEQALHAATRELAIAMSSS